MDIKHVSYFGERVTRYRLDPNNGGYYNRVEHISRYCVLWFESTLSSVKNENNPPTQDEIMEVARAFAKARMDEFTSTPPFLEHSINCDECNDKTNNFCNKWSEKWLNFIRACMVAMETSSILNMEKEKIERES